MPLSARMKEAFQWKMKIVCKFMREIACHITTQIPMSLLFQPRNPVYSDIRFYTASKFSLKTQDPMPEGLEPTNEKSDSGQERGIQRERDQGWSRHRVTSLANRRAS